MIDPKIKQAAANLMALASTGDSIWFEELDAEIAVRVRGLPPPGREMESASFTQRNAVHNLGDLLHRYAGLSREAAQQVAIECLLPNKQRARLEAIAKVHAELQALQQQQKTRATEVARTVNRKLAKRSKGRPITARIMLGSQIQEALT